MIVVRTILWCCVMTMLATHPGSTAEIHEAVRGDVERVHSLIEEDPSVIDLVDDRERTPLHVAVESRNLEVVELLLSAGADVNARSQYQSTPLHLSDVPEMSELLLKHGADATAVAGGRTPFETAVEQRNVPLIQFYVNRGEVLGFEALMDLNRTEDVLALLERKPWLAKPPHAPLNAAIRHRNLRLVQALLDCGADPNFNEGHLYSVTALGQAFLVGDYDTARLLLEYGADPNCDTMSGQSLIELPHYATMVHDNRFLELLLANGVDVNTWDDGYELLTPLHIAALRGDIEKARMLVDHGARVSAEPGDGMTPLFASAVGGHNNVAEFLLSRGAEPDLYSACALGLDAVVSEFLDTDPTVVNEKDPSLGFTPLFYAVASGDVQMVSRLIQSGADLNVFGPDYTKYSFYYYHDNLRWTEPSMNTPLLVAIDRGDLGIVRLLIENGVDVNQSPPEGPARPYSPLMDAVLLDDREEIAIELIRHGADVNVVRQFGDSALSNAVFGSPMLLRAFLEADPEASLLSDALSRAIGYDQDNSARMLMDAGVAPRFFDLCRLGDVRAVARMLEAEPDLARSRAGAGSPLAVASEYGHVDLVKLLVEEYNTADHPANLIDPLVAAASQGHLSVLEYLLSISEAEQSVADLKQVYFSAVEDDQVEVVEYLLDGEWAELDWVDERGDNAVIQAASAGSTQVLRILVGRGMHVDSQDRLGWTSLHRATRRGDPEMVKTILDLGADPSIEDLQGRAPNDLAVEAIRLHSSVEDADDRTKIIGLLNSHSREHE